MLLKAEKMIISDDDVLSRYDTSTMLRIVTGELSEKIAEDMIQKDLIKIVMTDEFDDVLGPVVRIRAAVRAYHPDS